MRDGAAIDEPLQFLVQRLEPLAGGVVVGSVDNEQVAQIRGAELLAQLAIASRAVGRHRRQRRDAVLPERLRRGSEDEAAHGGNDGRNRTTAAAAP